MSQLGVGVMIQMLSGNEDSVKAFQSAIGKTIASVVVYQQGSRLGPDPDELRIAFTDGTGVALYDNGQSCCESRYMHTDDDLKSYVGAVLLDGEIREAPSVSENPCDYHDVEFLDIKTSVGVLTVSNHNEHNGYYGGFAVRAKEWVPS